MAELIRVAVLGYSNVFKVLKERTDSTKPMTLKDIMFWAEKEHGGVKSFQQCVDACKTFHARGQVGKIREGLHVKYWMKPEADWPADMNTRKPRGPNKPKPVETPVQVSASLGGSTLVNSAVPPHNKPDIIVTPDKVVIVTQQCKITVEF